MLTNEIFCTKGTSGITRARSVAYAAYDDPTESSRSRNEPNTTSKLSGKTEHAVIATQAVRQTST